MALVDGVHNEHLQLCDALEIPVSCVSGHRSPLFVREKAYDTFLALHVLAH